MKVLAVNEINQSTFIRTALNPIQGRLEALWPISAAGSNWAPGASRGRSSACGSLGNHCHFLPTHATNSMSSCYTVSLNSDYFVNVFATFKGLNENAEANKPVCMIMLVCHFQRSMSRGQRSKLWALNLHFQLKDRLHLQLLIFYQIYNLTNYRNHHQLKLGQSPIWPGQSGARITITWPCGPVRHVDNWPILLEMKSKNKNNKQKSSRFEIQKEFRVF